jgi:hypothetical protein
VQKYSGADFDVCAIERSVWLILECEIKIYLHFCINFNSRIVDLREENLISLMKRDDSFRV